MTQRTIGLLGGMSWESTAIYYDIINTTVGERLGGLHSADLVMVSVDFEPLAALQRNGDWNRIGELLGEGAARLEAAGADAVVLCTNTMHLVAPQIEDAISVPLLHIVDAVGEALAASGITTAGLLGTRFTMAGDLFPGRLGSRFGIETLMPAASCWDDINRIIFDELCHGEVRDASRATYLDVIDTLASDGAQAVILGCTEIGMLIDDDMSLLPVFDTARLHAMAAASFALSSR